MISHSKFLAIELHACDSCGATWRLIGVSAQGQKRAPLTHQCCYRLGARSVAVYVSQAMPALHVEHLGGHGS